MTSPPPPAGSSSRAPTRAGFLGLPWWAWGIAAGAAAGAFILIRRSKSKNAAAADGTATQQGVTEVNVPSDQQIGLTQYEQISAELVGIEGTDQALLAAIKDLQGDESKDGDGDHDCPKGRHWDAAEKRCVKDRDDDDGKDKDVKVPDVEGERRSEAARRIRRAGLNPRFRAPFSGQVKEEQPPAGRSVERGSTVTLASRRPHSPGK